MGDIERARICASYALSRAESRATESVDVADSLLCYICHERRKDTALNCGHLLCGSCAGRVHVCPECRCAITWRARVFL